MKVQTILRRRWVWVSLVVSAVLLGLGPILVLAVFDRSITEYVNGPGFLAELDKQTSRGLHFIGGYDSIKRTGLLSIASPHFHGSKGVKTFQSIDAQGITGDFNPWGIYLRRWQIDHIHIDSAQARIQTYTPKPPEKKSRPWYAIFLPDRMYLKEVVCDDTDITWELRDKESGFLGTRLLITPHGRDFEYRATGGKFRQPPAPDLPLSTLHMLVTKDTLSLYDLSLAPSKDSSIRLEGSAGLKEDKYLRASLQAEHVPIAPWISTPWQADVRGTLTGRLTCESPDQKLESSSAKGRFRIDGGRLLGIPFLDYVASATRNEDLKYLDLQECSLAFSWKYPVLSVNDIVIVAKDAFQLRGSLKLDGSVLSGEFDFGVRDENLDWLPRAREEIFTRASDGYRWTKVRVSGPLRDPQNDLTPRMASALRRSPGVAAGLFFRQLGEWFEQTFDPK